MRPRIVGMQSETLDELAIDRGDVLVRPVASTAISSRSVTGSTG